MKKLTIFYLQGCPWCAHARRAVRELLEEPEFSGAQIEWIDERAEPGLADRYDYWHVPAAFDGDRKLYEALSSHSYEDVLAGLRRALGETQDR